jgi:hypothetical protein
MRRVPVLVAFLAALVAALCVAGAEAATHHRVMRASLGPWRATFSYDRSDGDARPAYSHLRLAVTRGSKRLLDTPVVSSEPGADHPEPALGAGPSLFFRDLDGDGSPELVLELYTGGAHCCYVDQVFDFGAPHPLKVELDLADAGAKVVVAHGKPLLQSADESFAYAFTAYAGSGAPILLLRYLGGRFEDVTRDHVQLVSADASRWWRAAQAAIDRKDDARGVLAAWAADEAILGQAPVAKKALLAYAAAGKIGGVRGPGWPTGRAYVTKLWTFLAKRGYL